MEIDWDRYRVEIVEFLNVETLRQIDCGILDLSGINDYELKGVLLFFEELLFTELKVNYLKNDTGIFRVSIIRGKYCYNEFGHIIEADSIDELKRLVISQNRIWYVFDDILAEEIMSKTLRDRK